MNTRRKHQTMAVKLVRKLFADADKKRCLPEVRDLVSAIRGPDHESAYDKCTGTIPIRCALVTRRQNEILGFTSSKKFTNRLIRKTVIGILSGQSSHFDFHIRRAANVLNGVE
jgi:hypothetical protein